MSNQTLKINKDTFIKALLVVITLHIFYSQNLFSEEEESYLLSGPLAGSFYHTKEKPGRWSKLAGSHLSSYKIKNNILEISTGHEMKGYDHYIIKHMILDKRFNLISEKLFDPSREIPVSKHNIIGYTERLYVLSICNKHDIWLDVIKLK